MNSYLQQHQQQFPVRTIQDDFKFLYQYHLGCEHFVMNPERTLNYIKSEPTAYKEMVIEPISERFVRVHFGKLSDSEASLLNRIFVKSSQIKGSKEDLLNELEAMKNDENKEAIEAYIKEGVPSVHHSDTYKETYNPCYRVCLKKYMQYWDVLLKVEELEEGIIGIDGRCGSGKSTLGEIISELFDLQLVHMDDFYLPLDMRTKERLSTPGGNVHYERVKQEIMEPISKQQDTTYGVFDCSVMAVNSTKQLQYETKIVVEGSYAFVKELRDYYSLKIFSTISKEAQKQRIINREGIDGWPMFENRWIPFEELYFSNNNLEEIADIIVDSSDF